MKRLACFGAFLTLFASSLVPSGSYAGQQDNGAKQQSTAEERAKWPLPPDLVHFRGASCTLFKFAKESALNAKTGLMEPVLEVWAVQPTASYDDGRQSWSFVRKSGYWDSIGDRKDGHEAWDLCMEWVAFTKAAAKAAKAKAGHSASKDASDFEPTPAQWTYLYDVLNKKFFNDALPYAVIRSSPIPTDMGQIGWTHFDNAGVPHIIMSDKYITCLDVAVIYLVHEMVHVKLKTLGSPNWTEHGQEFQAEMLRLAEAGAFKESW